MANAIKSIVLTPELLGLSGFQSARNRIGSAEDSYARVPLVFRATRIRCNSLLKIPFHLYRDDGATEAEWPFDYPLRKLLWRTRAAGLLTGAGYILKRRNRVMVKEVQWLNPTTMQVTWDSANRRRLFDQYVQGEHFGPWPDEDMVYIPEFTLRDDIGPGDCPASVALNSAQLSHYITRMASTFFESGAMPVTLLASESGFGTDTEKIENYFQRLMQGIRNAYRVIAVRGKDVSFERLQFPLKELATPELRDQARKDVALSFEIPVTLLDDDANYATAKEHKRSFYDETVIPDADVFAEELNAQLLEPLGLRLEFKPEEMDLYQDDERESAQAAATFATMLSGMPDFETFEFVARTYGIEYDEALAKKVFAAKDKRRDETQAAFDGFDTRTKKPQATADDDDAAEEEEDKPPAAPFLLGKTAITADLAKWERAALKRIKHGGDLSFNSDVIPKTLAASIHGALEAATSPDEVRGTFAHVRTWVGYP